MGRMRDERFVFADSISFGGRFGVLSQPVVCSYRCQVVVEALGLFRLRGQAYQSDSIEDKTRLGYFE